MTIRALIADDEPLARTRVRQLLLQRRDVEIVGECGSAEEVVTAVGALRPQLLLLDVELGGPDGFAVLRQLPERDRPCVIFTTAHSEFAARAFDVAAADFLVKPFDRKRLDQALDRALQLMSPQKVQPARAPVAGARKRDRVAVKRKNEIIFVRAADIEWIQAEGNYSRLQTKGGSYLIRESLQSLDDSLDGATFVRVHRSAIVNVEHVVKIVGSDDGGSAIVLTSGELVALGPSYRSRLEDLVGQKL